MLVIDLSDGGRSQGLTLYLAGALDSRAGATLATVLEAMAVPAGARVTVDTAHVRFCDWAGLNGLLDAHRRLAIGGADLRVVRPSARVRSMLHIAHGDWLLSDPVAPAPVSPAAPAPSRWRAAFRHRASPNLRGLPSKSQSRGPRLRLCKPVG